MAKVYWIMKDQRRKEKEVKDWKAKELVKELEQRDDVLVNSIKVGA